MQLSIFEANLKQKAIELLNAVIETDNRKNRTTDLAIIKINANLYLLASQINGSKVFNLVDYFGKTPNGMSANWRNFEHIKHELTHETNRKPNKRCR